MSRSFVYLKNNYTIDLDFSSKNNNVYLVSPFDEVYPELAATLPSHRSWFLRSRFLRSLGEEGWRRRIAKGGAQPKDYSNSLRMTKKIAFLAIFLLTIFENTLKYTYVSQ